MKSDFFYQGHYKKVEEDVKSYLNEHPEFLSSETADSPRAVGDAVERIIAGHFEHFLGEWCDEYSSEFSRRAMADLAFKDRQGIYCIVDVKTHRTDLSFSMPALVSIERLARFYEDDSNVFSILMVKYGISGNELEVSNVHFCPVEFLDWSCLTIGALGWGQLQIANSNNIKINPGYSRKQWMLALCDNALQFYPREIGKIRKRENKFSEIQADWKKKDDIWGG